MAYLTREYFEKHPQWEIKNVPMPNENGYVLWEAVLVHKCDEKSGDTNLYVTNSMYEHRFAMNGWLNGTGEGYFQGDIFVSTIEELENFFRIVHFDAYQYTL